MSDAEIKTFSSERIGQGRQVTSFVKNSKHARLYHVYDSVGVGPNKSLKSLVLRVYPLDLSGGVGYETLNMSLSWNLRHQNLVRTYDLQLVNKGKKSMLFFLLEKSQGSLLDWLRSKPETDHTEKMVRMMYDIVQGVWFLHQNQLCHENLHPGNVQIFKTRLKLSDFYHTRFTDQNPYRGPVNEYTAPELFYGKIPYRPSADLWSVGVMLYEILYQKLPFDDGAYREAEQKTRKPQDWLKGIWDVLGVPPREWRVKYTGKEETDHEPIPVKTLKKLGLEACCRFQPKLFDLTLDLLSGLLTLDPEKRLTAEQAVKHPLFLEFKFRPQYELQPKLLRPTYLKTKQLKEWREQVVKMELQNYEFELVDYRAVLMGIWLFDVVQSYFIDRLTDYESLSLFFDTCMWTAVKLMSKGEKMGGLNYKHEQQEWQKVIQWETDLLNCIRFVFPYDEILELPVKSLSPYTHQVLKLA